MKVLVCGASGFIGTAVAARLAAAGHHVLRGVRHVERAGDVAIDYGADLQPCAWLDRLRGVDAVVNAVGIIRENGAASFEALHSGAPAALFAACAEAGVRRVVQVSALGAGQGDTAYFASKRAADEVLMSLPLEWIILRPALVFGREGGSAAMFCRLASMPLTIAPALGAARFQPLHVDDLADAVVAALDPETPAQRVFDIAGSTAVGYEGMLAAYRSGMGFAPAPVLRVPAALMALAARAGRSLPAALLTPDNWRMLRAGSALAQGDTAGAAATRELLGRAPRAVTDFIPSAEREVFRLRALAAWRASLLRWTLAIVWLATALVSALIYPRAGSLALLAGVGIQGVPAVVALYGAAALDAALGIACIMRPRRALWLAQGALILGYSVAIAACLPEYLWHPFGPLLKNLPILAILVILYAEEKTWTT
ncbi:SDR family oxidoreductase [Duganella sp. Root198D2]|uniref:SDR family oxidoreductase n=1 Tax=Duganella sp. Root198D2 TaxID=1736489 RepID=UPI00070F5E7B|nr:SDR family oxidoreductase [Duganella sp. Root198D2]KRB95885.1 NAD-dependent dehydratase [Duganella sp. Root198D2]